VESASSIDTGEWRLFYELSPHLELGPFIGDVGTSEDSIEDKPTPAFGAQVGWIAVPDDPSFRVGWIPRMKGMPAFERCRIVAVRTADIARLDEMAREEPQSLESTEGVALSPWFDTESVAPWYVIGKETTVRIAGIADNALDIDVAVRDIKGLSHGDSLFLGGSVALVVAAGLLFVIYRRRAASRIETGPAAQS